MQALELCIRGDLFFFERTLTPNQESRLTDFTYQYFRGEKPAVIDIDTFIATVRNELGFILKPIKITHVIAV